MILKTSYTEQQQMVRECLWRDWDPIGVNCFSEAKDDYYSYAPAIAAMLLDSADAFKVLEHLKHLETSHEHALSTCSPNLTAGRSPWLRHGYTVLT